jgi:hypothetical protein
VTPDRKGLIKIIFTRYFLVIKEIKKISSRYDFDQYFWSGNIKAGHSAMHYSCCHFMAKNEDNWNDTKVQTKAG